MSLLEAVMLVCFGLSWPVSIAKALRTHNVAGKSPVFMILIMIGYACGVGHKLTYNSDWVTGLYVLNMVMVAIDLGIYCRYSQTTANDDVNDGVSARTQETCSVLCG